MAESLLNVRRHNSNNERHRDAVNTYIAKHGRAARVERARNREITAALELCLLYCPGLPYGHSHHDKAQMRAALDNPSEVILACGVSYNRILRDKRLIEKNNARANEAWLDSMVEMEFEDDRFIDGILYGSDGICEECGDAVDNDEFTCVSCRIG